VLADKKENPRILPAVLYKYMSANRSTFFDDWLIRFTQPIALNDPFEMRPHIAGYGTPEEVREIATRRWEEHVRKQYAAIVRKSIGQGEPMKFDIFNAEMEHTRASQIENALLQAPAHNAVMAEQINELVNKSIGVLSLCEHYDSLLMWPHYGDIRPILCTDSSRARKFQSAEDVGFNKEPTEGNDQDRLRRGWQRRRIFACINTRTRQVGKY
jgi:hypothetical protein